MNWILLALASAGTMRATVELGPDGPVVLHLVESSASPRFLPAGDLQVLDAQGGVLGSAAVPDPRIRSVITPEGGDAVHLERARIDVLVPWPAGAESVALGGGSLRPTASQRTALPTAHSIQLAGPPDTRLDLVFLADGYRADQLGKFADDVDRIVSYLLTIEPYVDYASLLNIWRIDTVSNQAGGDHPELGNVFRDTALGCAYDCAGIDRLICCDDNAVMGLVNDVIPDAEGVIVLVNDDVYGGSGGFNYAVSYSGTSSNQVAAHELGHSLIGLWDEYGYGTSGNGTGPNCSPNLEPHWTPWVGTEGVGAFQECTYTGHYRPTENECMMRTLSDDYCPVCRQEVVRAMYGRLPGIVVSAEPELGATVSGGTIEVETVVPKGMLTYEWLLDGAFAGDRPTWDVPCGELGGQLQLTVRDDTHYVRSDPTGLLEDTVGSWLIAPVECAPEESLAELCGCSTGGEGGAGWLLLPLALGLRRRPV